MNNRRKFIQQSLLTVGTSLVSAPLLRAESFVIKSSKIEVKQNDIILFQGDSITDHNRNREILSANDLNGLGRGYSMVAASQLLNKFAEKNIKVYNRGIGGNKVPQLMDRWQTDCIDLKPNILSILIGVNDYWHKRDGKYEGNAQSFKDQYRKLLDDTLHKLPNVQLIIGEPFAVNNVKHVNDSWYPEFQIYQQAVRDIAKEFKTAFIPYQEIFDKAQKKASGSYWAYDGVHTTPAGINLMAEAWLSNIK